MSNPPSNRIVWFAVLGGATAWAVQFVINLYVTWAQCNAPPGRWQLPVHGLAIASSVVAVGVGLAASFVSLRLYRSSAYLDHAAESERRGQGGGPPTGRVAFLSMVGLAVNFLSLSIVVMTGIGEPLLRVCQQS